MGISQGFAVAPEDDREALNHSLELVCSYDLDGSVIDVSHAAQRIIGFTRQEILGMNISALIGKESWDLSRKEILGQMDGSPRDLEIVARGKQGEDVKLAVTRRLVFERG